MKKLSTSSLSVMPGFIPMTMLAGKLLRISCVLITDSLTLSCQLLGSLVESTILAFGKESARSLKK